MDRLEAMRVFATVADRASFAAAARHLALTPARVTRAVAALEARIGARLLHRTTRSVRLTDAGASYLAQCKRILADIDEAEALAASAQASLSGQLTVTAPVLFGRLHVAPILLDFLQQNPGVTVRALLADRVIDLQEQNVDVAVRIAHLPDSSLRAIRVGSVRRVVCASPEYLRAHGVPRDPSELAGHAMIAFAGLGEPRSWSFSREGKLENVQPRARMVVNSVDLALLAACAGHALAYVLSYQAAAAVRARRLRVVLSEFEVPPVPVHVVHREGRSSAARVRAFVALAVDRLRATLRADDGLGGPRTGRREARRPRRTASQ